MGTFSPNAGRVRSMIQAERTSGYPELDALTVEALRQWQFSPAPGADEKQQWGMITFTFSLGREK